MKKNYKGKFLRFLKSKWLFPAVVSLILIVLVGLKLNGSSVGYYHQIFYGEAQKDSNLIFGSPKPIRSDEWTTWTPQTISQDMADYSTYNFHRGSDADVSKSPEVPVKNWVNALRPQNWSFFVLPFEYAFAFHWWIVLYLLVLSCYFFVLRLLPNKKLLSALLSSSFALSPFLFWWYQSSIFMSMAYGFIIMCLGIRIITNEHLPKIKSKQITNGIYSIALGFLGASLALFFYPPYAIPVLIVSASFLLGTFINNVKSHQYSKRELIILMIPFAVGTLIAVLIVVAFMTQHQDMIQKTSQTLYPGLRRTSSGGLSLLRAFDGFIMPILQSTKHADHFYANQSEAANFILLLPFLFIPAIILQWISYKKFKKIDWAFSCIQLCALVFFVRAYVPINSVIYKLFLLDWVPNARLQSGMGFVGLIQIVYVIKSLSEIKLKFITRLYSAIGAGLISFGIMLWVGVSIMHTYPLFLNNFLLMIGLSGLLSMVIALFLMGKYTLASALLLIFTLGSSFWIFPIYRGLSVIRDTPLVKSIQEISTPEDNWIVVDDLDFSNFPLLAGRNQLDGTQEYPDFKLWEKLGKQYEPIYNRQAKSFFTTHDYGKEKIYLVQPNQFEVKFECSSFVLNHVDFALSGGILDHACASLIRTVVYPNKTFYLYKIGT